jgi:hypothetical protein
MKLIIQLVLWLYSTASCGQLLKTTTIKLSTGDCRRDKAYSWSGADTITFYKLPEDTIAFKIIPRKYRQFPINIENVIIGNYKMLYKSNFDQLITKQVSLTDQKTNSIVICPDILLEYPQNTLSKFKDKDTISINFHSQGCFHTAVSKILISKEADKYVARLYNINWNYLTKRKKTTMQSWGDSLLKTVTLTNKNIQDFIRFENELNFVTDEGCTTTDWYDIKSKFLNTKKTDGSCSWNGFYYLRISFFGNKE